MLIEITEIPTDIIMNKWHLIYAINGIIQTNQYIDFKLAWDLDGNKIPELRKGMNAIVEVDIISIAQLKNEKDYYFLGRKFFTVKKPRD